MMMVKHEVMYSSLKPIHPTSTATQVQEAPQSGEQSVPENASSWGFIPPKLWRIAILQEALTPRDETVDKSKSKAFSDMRKMLPPRLSTEPTKFKDKVGGDVRPDLAITEKALTFLRKYGAIDVVHQNPPSAMRLHAGHMHLVFNHGTQIKFAAEVLDPDEVVIASVYHKTLGSVYFAESNAEDYTSMYVKLEDDVKRVIAGTSST
jgi:hypothetical protein